MYFLLGMLCGMLLFICPDEFIWLPLCLLPLKPKQTILGCLLGYILVSMHIPAIKFENRLLTLTVRQLSHRVFNKARFEVISANKPFKQGDLIQAKVAQDFYQKTSLCRMLCTNVASNDWYGIAQGVVANCKISNCQVLTKPRKTRIFFEQHIPNNLQNSAIFKALLLGQSNLIPRTKKQLFKFAGLAHLIAVSGLHIGIIAHVTGFVFGRTWLLLVSFFWRIPQAIFTSFGSACGAIFYAWLSGFGDSSCRALVMVLVANLFQHLKLKVKSEDILFVAMIIILFVRPLSVFSLGFWLSVIAVWALINSKNNILSAQLNIMLVMLPIQALYKWPMGWWMPFANFISIPLFSILLVPASFLAWLLDMINPASAHFFWLILDKILSYFFQVLSICQTYLGNGYYLPFAGYWQVFILAFLVFAFIKRHYFAAVVLAILLTYEHQQKISYGDFKIEVLDVAQGLAVIIRTAQHQILVDTGSEFKGQQVVLPALKGEGINTLDKIIVSHGDSDHSGGLDFITKNIKYKEIIAGEPSRIHRKSVPCSQKTWAWDGVVFSTYQVHIDAKHNNASCILHVQSPIKSALFPGDIEADAEHALLKMIQPRALHSDILIAAHHGSISSSSKEFITAVAPSTIIVSAGRYEQYKHPAKAHIKSWLANKIKVLNTHNLGTVKL